jgi:S-adenosylmethionine:tRNA ribosyltransferase-isomerase
MRREGAPPVPKLSLAEFDFDLPEELIARRPIVPRDAARMLEVAAALHDRHVRDLPGLLAPGDLLVFNDTRVIEARLTGTRAPDSARGAAKIEVTLHKQEGPAEWRAFARPGKRLRVRDTIEFAPDFSATVTAKLEEGEIALLFDCGGDVLRANLARFGAMPLPPYIASKRAPDARDKADYQTLFARADGAVAAPTAGLHFTPRLMAALEARGIETAPVTLHVGAGTFLPVKTENVLAHRMHAESGTIPEETARRIDAARASGKRIVAVGTTVLRLLESAATDSGVRPFSGETDIFITPGFRFRAVDLLLTNFHLPRSTLFILVCAFAGTARMRAAYAHAIAQKYRFYSYGDCCLLHRAGQE